MQKVPGTNDPWLMNKGIVPHNGIDAGCVIVLGQLIVPEFEYPLGTSTVNVIVLDVSVETSENVFGDQSEIDPRDADPGFIIPLDDIC